MMRDREFVNRFCAFKLLPIEDYRGDMDDFLAKGLTKMNNLGTEALQKLSAQFRTSLHSNFKVFGKHACRKHIEGQDSRSVLNASLWDVMSTGLAGYPEHLVEARTEGLKSAFYTLMLEDDFVRSITYSVNDTNRVKYRFSVAGAMFKEVFDAH